MTIFLSLAIYIYIYIGVHVRVCAYQYVLVCINVFPIKTSFELYIYNDASTFKDDGRLLIPT